MRLRGMTCKHMGVVIRTVILPEEQWEICQRFKAGFDQIYLLKSFWGRGLGEGQQEWMPKMSCLSQV